MADRIPNLKVIFDTNILFTKVASDLVSKNLRDFISENSEHSDLNVEWYLPQVVVNERKFQMIKKAKDLLPSLTKLERLLGHKFAVGEDTLELHVDKAIEKGVSEHRFSVVDVNTKIIDWGEIINRSVSRMPPFEDSSSEKGFRDSIIAHSFVQLIKNSPKTPSICRLHH
ncbi:PIN domain-containing protein [Kangiella japonica]